MKRKCGKLLSVLLTLAMLVSMIPVFPTPEAEAADLSEKPAKSDSAGKGIPVSLGKGTIGNSGGIEAKDVLWGFDGTNITGFELTGKAANSIGTFYFTRGGSSKITIRLDDNPTLKLLKAGGTAEYMVKASLYGPRNFHEGQLHHDYNQAQIEVYEDGNMVWDLDTPCDGDGENSGDSGWRSLSELNTIELCPACDYKCNCGPYPDIPKDCEITLSLFFRDLTPPTVVGYSCDTNGENAGDQLLLNLGTLYPDNPDLRYVDASIPIDTQDYVDVFFEFSKDVKPDFKVEFKDDDLKEIQGELGTLTNLEKKADEERQKLTKMQNALDSSQSYKNKGIPEFGEFLQSYVDVIKEIKTQYQPEHYELSEEDEPEEGEPEEGEPKEDKPTYILIKESNPYADELIKAASAPNLSQPEMPKEPEDMTDAEAVGKYQAAMQTYATEAYAYEQVMLSGELAKAVYNGDYQESLKFLAAYYPERSQKQGQSQSQDQEKTKFYGYIKGLSFADGTDLTQKIENACVTLKSYYEATEEQAMLEEQLAVVDTMDEEVKTQIEKVEKARNKATNNAVTNLAAYPYIVAATEHTLFTNALGTGYIGMGQDRGLELYRIDGTDGEYILQKYNFVSEEATPAATSAALLANFAKQISYRYSASRGDYIPGSVRNGGGIANTANGKYEFGDKRSLLQKILDAGFHDAAGNPIAYVSDQQTVEMYDPESVVEEFAKVGVTISVYQAAGMSDNEIEKIIKLGKPFGVKDPKRIKKIVPVYTPWKDDTDKALSGMNIFNAYEVKVDAEPPTYSRVDNGITPDILTRLTLNKNDELEFIVSFSEAVRIKSGMDINDTYILFNNGAKAYYARQLNGGKQWVFTYKVKGKNEEVEAPLWKAIALTNKALDDKLLTGTKGTGNARGETLDERYGRVNDALTSFYVDGRVISDFTGNIMADRANETKLTNTLQIESSTEWASLKIDNTEPEITFDYIDYISDMSKPTGTKDGKAEDWGQGAYISVKAHDPNILVPIYDPTHPTDQELSQSGSGIFHPDNTSASSEAPSTAGLIYYVWSQDPNPPSTGVNYEVIKRFSLAAWDETANKEMENRSSPYASWSDLIRPWVEKAAELNLDTKKMAEQGLMLAQTDNYANIMPPEVAFDPEYSGPWYLHVWTADMTWDSARQLMQYDMLTSQKYSTHTDIEFEGDSPTGEPYTAAEALALKTALTDEAYVEELSALIAKKVGDDDSPEKRAQAEKEAMQELSRRTVFDTKEGLKETYLKTIYTEQYLKYLEEAKNNGLTGEDDMVVYANNQVMKSVGNYHDTNIWKLELFRNDDSNWIQKTAEVRLDNLKPTVTVDFGDVQYNGTAKVKLGFTVSDAHSGIDVESIQYQWVKKPEGTVGERPGASKKLSDIDWITASPTDVTVSADAKTDGSVISALAEAETQNNVFENGDYYLSVQVQDRAGNLFVYHSEDTVTVDDTVKIACAFAQLEPEAKYFRSVTPMIHVDGIRIREVRYAVTDSVAKPAGECFAPLTNDGAEDTDFDKHYTLPELNKEKADGNWYVHILVYEDSLEGGEPFYFYELYRLDNTAPALYLNPVSGGIKKTEYSVSITVADTFSGIDEASIYYQWTASAAAPSEDDASWIPLEGNTVTKKVEREEEAGSYYLHVKVKDAVGNQTISSSEEFCFIVEKIIDMAEYRSNLRTVYQQEEKFYGVAYLYLDTMNKAGYRYSVTNNAGKSWSNWQPYSTMVEFSLPIESAKEAVALEEGTLMVRFRSPSGEIGEPEPITTALVEENLIWATLTPESVQPRQPEKTLYLLANVGEGVTMTASSTDVVKVVKDEEGDFAVKGNGVYDFILSRGEETEPFSIVIDFYDGEKPQGVVHYSETAPTTENVLVQLEADEPVGVAKIAILDDDGNETAYKRGSPSYIFTENGKIRFYFRDAAGNENSIDAEVHNIDRDAPDVEIQVLYSNGKDTTYQTFVNEDGETLSHGLFLKLAKIKSGNQKDFTIVGVNQSDMMEVTENGFYSFTVQDNIGNIAVVGTTINSIVKDITDYSVSYAFASSTNLVPGEVFLKEDVVVTVRIPAPKDGRKIYVGTTAASESLDRIGDDFVIKHTYSANGSKSLRFNDGLGGVFSVPITVTGIDGTKPTLTLNETVALLELPEDDTVLSGEALAAKLGGYEVYDKETPDELTVTLVNVDRTPISFDKNTVGVFTVRYYVTDTAGNENFRDQTVYAINPNEMYVRMDEALLANASNKSTTVSTNHVSFTIDKDKMEQMFYQGRRAYNRKMQYDVYYVGGLYREGQLKYIAEKITGAELENKQFNVVFEQTGWYTIIIRNQERSRIYTYFFISNLE